MFWGKFLWSFVIDNPNACLVANLRRESKRTPYSGARTHLLSVWSHTSLSRPPRLWLLNGALKMNLLLLLLLITLPNVDRFSNFLHQQTQQLHAMKWSLKIPAYLKRVATHPCELWSVNVRKLAIIWKIVLFIENLKPNLNVLTDVCHGEYSKCPPAARMQTWIYACADGQWRGR